MTVTYLPGDGSEGFTQDMGVRIKGGASRGNNQKSLRLIAREQYGEKQLKYPKLFARALSMPRRICLKLHSREPAFPMRLSVSSAQAPF